MRPAAALLLCPVPPQKEAQDFISTSDCPDYLRKAERRLHEEVERCAAYLDATTEPKITRVVETELLRNQVRVGKRSPSRRSVVNRWVRGTRWWWWWLWIAY